MTVESLLKEKFNMEFPNPPQPGGLYTPVIQTGNLVYVSGQSPTRDGQLLFKGVVGKDLNIAEAQEAARYAAVNCLALLKEFLGDLDRIKHFVQVIGYVRSAADFGDQPAVMNGASGLINEIFGKRGGHTRLALGTNELPGGTPVEIYCIVEV
jgi:enamine deaminase RidA (YjgF/YER057c/UK114 family)